MRYVTANKIREIDRLAQERFSIPSIILMENAGVAATREIIDYLDQSALTCRKAAIFCGKGNNGGDGFVVGRHLNARGVNVDIFLLGKPGDVKKADPAANLKILRKMGIKITEERDRLTIAGSPLKGSVIDSKGDHRIAMAFSVLGSVVGGIMIDGAECVSKTFPEFWSILKSIGVKLNE